MKLRRLSAAVALAATGALVLSSCAPGGNNGAPPEKHADGQRFSVEPKNSGLADLGDVKTQDGTLYLTVGATEFGGYNGNTPQNYNTYTTTPLASVFGGFSYYGTDGTIYENKEFGEFELISKEDDPKMKVKYTINEKATWSDGTPVGYADFLLAWATQNSAYKGADGKPLFNSVSQQWGEFVKEVPEGKVDSKEIVTTFDKPNPDWKLLAGGFMPAHVVAKQSGMSTEELVKAIQDKDVKKLEKPAKFWNTGWQTKPGTLPKEELIPSMGPYKLKKWDAGQSLTLEANDKYWGTKPGVKNLVYRFVEDDGHVAALKNGDLNAIDAHPTKDTLEQLQSLDNVIVHQYPKMTWEHLDFNFGPKAVFAKDKDLRKAFALCVPRQQIVDSLIKPLDPEAKVLNARERFPFQEGYDDLVKETYDGSYDEPNIEEAKKLVEKHANGQKIKVRIGYSSPNPRRTDTVAAIKASCDKAGFEILDKGSKTFFLEGGEQERGDYDVALFAWAGSGQIVSGQNIYSTNKPQNFSKYSNKTVDEAWEKMASTLDEKVHKEQVKIIEKQLWEDLHGIPLYAHPGLSASESNILNVRPTATQSGLFWNVDQWIRAE